MTRKANTLLLLLVVAALTCTLGACFFSVPANVGTVAAAASSTTGKYYDLVFSNPNSLEISTRCYDQYEEAIAGVSHFTYDFFFGNEDMTASKYHKLPSFTVITFYGGDLWSSSMKFAIVDTTNRIVAELTYNHFSMYNVDTNEILYETDFNTVNCNEIAFCSKYLKLTFKDWTEQTFGFRDLSVDNLNFDYLVANGNYSSGNGPSVTGECYKSQITFSYTIHFVDRVFPTHNKSYTYETDYNTDTIIAADIDGLVPEVSNTGNYMFLGWFSGTSTPADPLSGDIYFYAEYQKATITFQDKNGGRINSKTAYVGDTLGEVVADITFANYALPQNLDLAMVVTGDLTITLAEKQQINLKYFKLERYSVEVKGKTFNYDMLTYKTVTKMIPEGSLVDVAEFDNAYYNIMGKPYYETMPGFTFTGWDYDLTQPITAPLTITAQYDLPKVKVNYYSSNDILFETREYDLVKDNLLLPMPEFKNGLSYWEDFKVCLEDIFKLDFIQMGDDIAARDVANKMADHLTELYDDETNQIFVILAKPNLNSDVQKGVLGDLSADFDSHSAFMRMTGSRGGNDYVLYLNPQKMYVANVNYEISLSFGVWIDPVINGVGNAFTAVGNWFQGVGDWFGDNWQWFLWVVGAIVGVILLIVFGPVVLPIIITAIKFVFGLIVKFFQLIVKLVKKVCEWLGNLFNKIFRRKEK